MTTTPINVNGTASNVAADGSYNTASNSLTGKNQFLTLLINELQNQDPTAPTDEKQTLAQLAQFSQLEETQNLAQTHERPPPVTARFRRAQTLIGKTVTTATDTAVGVSGVVSSVSFSGGKTYLKSAARAIDASTITGIQQ